MTSRYLLLCLSIGFGLAAVSCSGCDDDPAATGTPPTSSTTSSTSSSARGTSVPAGPTPLATYEGSAIARDLASRYLVIADEDHDALRVIPLPLKPDAKSTSLPLPGPPAQVVVRSGQILVTVRQPSLLIALDTGTSTDPSSWKERWRTPLPADAWGLAVDTEQQAAYVSSAWAHQVSAVALDDGEERWSVEVAREPRGLLARGGELYVSHLIGRELTRLSDLDQTAPKVHRHDLPPAPLRTPIGVEPAASLGYALAASPDGRRLFVPRHAIGALGEWGWYGAGTIDVLSTAGHEPILDVPKARRAYHAKEFPDNSSGWSAERRESYYRFSTFRSKETEVKGGPTSMAGIDARNPRHVVYRQRTHTLLVAHEGTNNLVEYDALSPAPAALPMRVYDLDYEQWPVFEYPTRSGAPSGIALSADETTAWVYCRSTDDVVQTKLLVDPLDPRAPLVEESAEDAKAKADAARKAAEEEEAKQKGQAPDAGAGGEENDDDDDDEKTKKDGPVVVRLVDETAHEDPDDPSVKVQQMGRAAFYQAASTRIGEGVACSTCHPDGRDDGYVWREITREDDEGNEHRRLFASSAILVANNAISRRTWPPGPGPKLPDTLGGARQTPMLAGRVAARGPYGWRGEADTLPDRIGHGLSLHRSHLTDAHEYKSGQLPYFAAAISKFLRDGLRPPERPKRDLTSEEKRGKELFVDARVGCASCHNPDTHYSDGAVYPRIVTSQRGYVDEKNVNFKTPSLAFVSGTPPYFHDGSRSTLESVVENNMDRMGKTTQLSAEDRAALIAFVRTL